MIRLKYDIYIVQRYLYRIQIGENSMCGPITLSVTLHTLVRNITDNAMLRTFVMLPRQHEDQNWDLRHLKDV